MVGVEWHRAVFAVLLGAGTTGFIRLITANPWLGVFLTACTTMWYLGEAGELEGEYQAKKEEVVELEKQVIVLKSALHDMATSKSEYETQYRRSRSQGFTGRTLSTSSL